MTRYLITRLEIEGFRGVNNEGDPFAVAFKQDTMNSVFAPNAQGKSSIFEALCFLIKGHIPKLSALQNSEHPEEYYANLFHSQRISVIKITLQPDDGSTPVLISVVRNPDGTRIVSSESGHSNPEQLLASLDNEFCLLDYKTFVRFVEDSPLGRGRLFSALLGLAPISEMRQALEVLSNAGTMNRDLHIDSLQFRRNSLTQKKHTLEGQLRTSYSKLTGQTLGGQVEVSTIVRNATSALRSVSLLSPVLEGSTILEVSFDALRQKIHDTERSDLQETLRVISASIVELQTLAATQEDVDEFESIRSLSTRRADALLSTKGHLLRSHYQTALQVVRSSEWPDPSICPTCDFPQEETLVPKLEQKLAQYDTVDSLEQQGADLWNKGHIGQKLNDLFSTHQIAHDPAKVSSFSALSMGVRKGEATPAEVNELAGLWNEADSLRQSMLKTAEIDRLRIQQLLPPSLVSVTEQVAWAEQVANLLKELSRVGAELSAIASKLSIRERWVAFVQRASSMFAQAEVVLSTAKTTDLEQDYQGMYRLITNNPAIVPRLVKASGTEDLYLTLDNFYGLSNLSAQAVLSESHRNALALSIFLSAALESKVPSSFIVLDDVTSSFDAGHQFALMELLRTSIARSSNPHGPQIILLSHDSLLEKYFDRISSEVPWFHQRIQGLPPHGAVFTQAQDANRIRTNATQFLRAGQTEQAIPLVRQYLEFKLLEVTRKVNIPVPLDFSIREDRRMAQNCLDAINLALDLEGRAGSLIVPPPMRQQLTTILIPSLIANWLSHYSTGTGAGFTPHVLLGVLDTIDSVANCFKYDCHCNNTTVRRYYKSLATKACTC